jgi:probable poly-beta-1,6-N-acetyl-D-glucosamine export protein
LKESIPSQNKSSKKYFYELNFVRAIACLLVVMVHVTARNYHMNDQTFNWATMFLNQVSRLGTPLFAIISGFLLYNQAINNRGFQINRFVSSRFTKVVIPFVVWSFVYMMINSYRFPWTENGHESGDFLTSFFLGDGYYHLYFMMVVVQFYIVFPFLQFLNTKKWMIGLTILAFFINYYHMKGPLDTGNELANLFTHDRSSLFYWIFFFMIGGLLVHYWASIMKWVEANAKFCLLIALMMVGVGVYEYQQFGFYSSTRVTNLIIMPIFFVALTGGYFLMGNLEKIRKQMIELGNLSMGIYLVHPLVLFFIQQNVPFLLERTRWIPVAFVLTVLISILIVKLIFKLPMGQNIVTVAGKKRKKLKVGGRQQKEVTA